MKKTHIIIWQLFGSNLSYRAALELVKRGRYVIVDQVDHFWWKWVAIKEI